MIDLLIDRVGNVNVFNFLLDGQTNPESHLQSIMDLDLISEYVKEVESLSNISLAVQANPSSPGFSPDILNELKTLGETFYLQFFPKEIANKLRMTNERFLHFNIDAGLSNIPWELLHDGESFLADKFFIGKTVKGGTRNQTETDRDKIRMLIVVDPTEDLKWAEREGEELYKTLKTKVSSSKLELSFIGGKQITKLKLLSLIKDKNIIHYSGHLYFSDDPLENGWLLSNQKILKAREIKNCGFSTDLVFSNSCESQKSASPEATPGIMNYFAGSFLMSGIRCFIGTNWETIDNEKTLDFTIRFYLSLLNDKSVGESLHTAREFARRNYQSWDLTWGNYSLHGVPNYIIFNQPKKSIEKIINPNSIINYYPSPIAAAYQNYLELEKQDVGVDILMPSIVHCFEEFSKVIGIITLSNHSYQSLGEVALKQKKQYNLREWWNTIFDSLWDFKKLEISMVMDSISKVFFSNRDIVLKMIDWIEKYHRGELEGEDMGGYLITYQYYFENLLIESKGFESSNIIYLSKETDNHLFFKGVLPSYNHLSFPENDFLGEQIGSNRGQIVLLNRDKKLLYPLDWLEVDLDTEEKLLKLNPQLTLFQYESLPA
ncbi:MAG: CHAT domain-containing protein [Spirochaetota bacterium]